MLHIIVTGAPGSGKGTQSANIAKKYDLIHISTGELLREEVELHTTLAHFIKKFIDHGSLVPDDIVNHQFLINTMKYENVNGFLYDGYPRTLLQAKYLDEVLSTRNRKISLVLSMGVEVEELYKRIQHRSTKSNRSDDTLEVIKNRLEIYRKQTLPLLNYYNEQGKLYSINGMAPEDTVFSSISSIIDNYLNNKF